MSHTIDEDAIRVAIKLIIAIQDTCTVGSILAEYKEKYGDNDLGRVIQIIKEEI